MQNGLPYGYDRSRCLFSRAAATRLSVVTSDASQAVRAPGHEVQQFGTNEASRPPRGCGRHSNPSRQQKKPLPWNLSAIGRGFGIGCSDQALLERNTSPSLHPTLFSGYEGAGARESSSAAAFSPGGFAFGGGRTPQPGVPHSTPPRSKMRTRRHGIPLQRSDRPALVTIAGSVHPCTAAARFICS